MYNYNVRVENKEIKVVANAVFVYEDAAKKYAAGFDKNLFSVRTTKIKSKQ